MKARLKTHHQYGVSIKLDLVGLPQLDEACLSRVVYDYCLLSSIAALILTGSIYYNSMKLLNWHILLYESFLLCLVSYCQVFFFCPFIFPKSGNDVFFSLYVIAVSYA